MANDENDAIRFRGHDLRIRHGSDRRHIIDDDVKSLLQLSDKGSHPIRVQQFRRIRWDGTARQSEQFCSFDLADYISGFFVLRSQQRSQAFAVVQAKGALQGWLAQVGIDQKDFFPLIGKNGSEIYGDRRFPFPRTGRSHHQRFQILINHRKLDIGADRSVLFRNN